jgi:GH24 family phage-related lysozyme (muramidase)
MSLKDCWAESLNFPDSFSKHFFRYLCIREGVVLQVYPDQKKIDTVGIGHMVRMTDGLKLGDLVTADYVLQTFKDDMTNNWSYKFAFSANWFDIPQQIAVASFAWTHGPGQFWQSYTHKLCMNQDTTEQTLQDWVSKNWDLKSPVNKVRNRSDLELIFSRQSADGIEYYISEHSDGNFVYVPSLDDSFTSLSAALDAAKKKSGGPKL